MRLAIPALLLAALTLQATPVPFLDGAGITSILNSVDATGAATTRITGDVDLTPGRFLHIPGYSDAYLIVEWLVVVNSTQPAPYLGAFDWAWDGEPAGRLPFTLSYTIPAEAAGVPEPGTWLLLLGGLLAFGLPPGYVLFKRRQEIRKEMAETARKAAMYETLRKFREQMSRIELHDEDERRG